MLPADDWQQCGLTDLPDLHSHSHTVCTGTIATPDFLQKWCRLAIKKIRTLSKVCSCFSKLVVARLMNCARINIVQGSFFHSIRYDCMTWGRPDGVYICRILKYFSFSKCFQGINRKKIEAGISRESGPRRCWTIMIAVWCRHNNSLAQWIEPRTRQRTDPWMNWIYQRRSRGPADTWWEENNHAPVETLLELHLALYS